MKNNIYEEPELKKVNLVAEEAVLNACKTEAPPGGPGQQGQGVCANSGACISLLS